MARLIFCCSLLLLSLIAFAQQDSMVYQNWKRDPNIDIATTVSNQKQIIIRCVAIS